MNSFKYLAETKSGEKVRGVVEAYDEFEAVAQIKDQKMTVLRIEQVEEGEKNWNIDLNEPTSISEKLLSLTASQFAILLRAGLPASRTVQIIAAQTTDKYMKKILEEVAEDVTAGYSLSSSLESRGKKIPVTFIETVRAGEESGTLEESFAKLSKYYEKSYKLHAKVKSALTYPAFLIVLAVIVIAIVVNVTVPVVSEVIYSAGGDLPGPTKILLGMYNFFRKWWPLVVGLIAALIIAIKLYQRSEEGKMKMAELAMKLPVIGNINVMNAASQFANTMTTLLTAGLPTTRALTITGKVVDNFAFGASLDRAVSGLEEGKALGDVLGDNEFLPPLLIEMTAVGEQSGSLDDTLTTIGAYYDSEVEQATAKALGMLEPAITIVMGVVIGFIVLALYMPMFTMYNSM
ncbi:MAG: type II secretion system F family protein [Eubacteriales bacterium]|nr:type II secretion system F family protein [Eubacteriales bacterium]